MLVREDLGLLLLGAREAVYALDINDISIKKSGVGTSVYYGYSVIVFTHKLSCVICLHDLNTSQMDCNKKVCCTVFVVT